MVPTFASVPHSVSLSLTLTSSPSYSFPFPVHVLQQFSVNFVSAVGDNSCAASSHHFRLPPSLLHCCCPCLSQLLLRSSPFSLLWFNGFAVCSFLTFRCYFRSFTSFSRFALFVFNFLYFSLLLSFYSIFPTLLFFFGNCCHCCASISKLVPFPGCLRPSPRTLRGNCKLRCIVQAS